MAEKPKDVSCSKKEVRKAILAFGVLLSGAVALGLWLRGQVADIMGD